MSIPENLIKDAEAAVRLLKDGEAIAALLGREPKAHMAAAAGWLEQTAAEIRKQIEIFKP